MWLGHRRGNGNSTPTPTKQENDEIKHPLATTIPRSRQEQGFWHQDNCQETREPHSFHLPQLLLFAPGPSWMELPQGSGEGPNFPQHQASGPPSQEPCPVGATQMPNRRSGGRDPHEGGTRRTQRTTAPHRVHRGTCTHTPWYSRHGHQQPIWRRGETPPSPNYANRRQGREVCGQSAGVSAPSPSHRPLPAAAPPHPPPPKGRGAISPSWERPEASRPQPLSAEEGTRAGGQRSRWVDGPGRASGRRRGSWAERGASGPGLSWRDETPHPTPPPLSAGEAKYGSGPPLPPPPLRCRGPDRTT